MRRIGRRQRWIVCGVAAACAILPCLLRPPERDLWKRAHLIAAPEDFVYPAHIGSAKQMLPLRVTADLPYSWVSPTTLLTLHFGHSLGTLTPRVVDMRTGRQLTTARLAEDISVSAPDRSMFIRNATGQPYITLFFKCQASPDGAWILLPRALYPGGSTRSVCAAVRLDDSRQVEWPIADNGTENTAWLRDGRRWAGIYGVPGEYEVRIFDLNRPEVFESHALAAAYAHGSSAKMAAPVLAGALPDGRLLAVYWQESARGWVPAVRFLADTESGRPQVQSIQAPGGRGALPVAAPVLSPAGDRLAWFITVPHTPLGWPKTRALWTLLKNAPSVQAVLWTTRPDGGDPREVGVYTTKDSDDVPALLQWTPDGRSLSFRHNGALYAVPAY